MLKTERGSSGRLAEEITTTQADSAAKKRLNSRFRNFYLLSGHCPHQRPEHFEPVRPAKLGFGGALRVGHHTENIASRAANTRNVLERSIGIGFRSNLAVRGRIANRYFRPAHRLACRHI